MVQHLSENGRMILVAQPPPGEELNIPNGVSLFGGVGQTIKASQGGKTNPTSDIPRYIKMHKSKLINIKSIITHRFSLEDVNQAFDLLRTGKAGRIMITLDK